MPALSVQDILACNCCTEYRTNPDRLYEIWDGAETLSAAQMLAKTDVPLGDRVWAMMQSEPQVDWSMISLQLYALIDAQQYSVAEGEVDLAAKFGPDAYTAAHHIEAYATEIGDSSLISNAVNIIREALP